MPQYYNGSIPTLTVLRMMNRHKVFVFVIFLWFAQKLCQQYRQFLSVTCQIKRAEIKQEHVAGHTLRLALTCISHAQEGKKMHGTYFKELQELLTFFIFYFYCVHFQALFPLDLRDFLEAQ